MKDYLKHKSAKRFEPPAIPIPVSNAKYHVTTQKRSLDDYAKAGGAQ